MKKFLGEGGLLRELDKRIKGVILIYRKVLNVDEKAASYCDLEELTDGTIAVRFERSYCGCCPGDEVDRFYVSQAMLENPAREIGKLLNERKRKSAERAEMKKKQEIERKKGAKKRRKELYENLKKEFKE